MNRLRIQRAIKGISQYELERKTGIPQSLLSLFENGFRQPDEAQGKVIAEVLGCNFEDIFPRRKTEK